MALATFKDLCFDADDVDRAARFWAATLGRRVEPSAPGLVLRGDAGYEAVWIDPVPEPKTVKHRWHLDLCGPSVEGLLALGASVIDDESFRWIVMADPEGAEFCVFVGDDEPAFRLEDLNVDCADHRAQAVWWQSVLGGTLGGDDDGTLSWIGGIPNTPFDGIIFADVPESKTVKNRVHIDLVAPSIDPLLSAGATLLRKPDDDIRWHVLADPEGNEFCVFDRA